MLMDEIFSCSHCNQEVNINSYAMFHARHIMTNLKLLSSKPKIEDQTWLRVISQCKTKIMELVTTEQYDQLFCTNHGPFNKNVNLISCPSGLLLKKEEKQTFEEKEEEEEEQVYCNCEERTLACVRIAKKEGVNKGRSFYGCANWSPNVSSGCKFIQWKEGPRQDADEQKEKDLFVYCKCGSLTLAAVRITKKGPNQGKAFYGCPNYGTSRACNFFQWKPQTEAET